MKFISAVQTARGREEGSKSVFVNNQRGRRYFICHAQSFAVQMKIEWFSAKPFQEDGRKERDE